MCSNEVYKRNSMLSRFRGRKRRSRRYWGANRPFGTKNVSIFKFVEKMLMRSEIQSDLYSSTSNELSCTLTGCAFAVTNIDIHSSPDAPHETPSPKSTPSSSASNSIQPTSEPARPRPHSCKELDSRRQDELSSSAAQNLLHDGICHDIRLYHGHSRTIDLLPVRGDHGCR